MIDQTSPVTYIIRNQLDGSTTKSHAEHLRIADLDQWELPKDDGGRPKRRAYYVVPPSSESSGDESSEDANEPLARIAKRYRQERTSSGDEDNIPLAELAKRLRAKKYDSEHEENMRESDDSTLSDKEKSDETDQDSMTIDMVTNQINPIIDKTVMKGKPVTESNVKQLLKAVARLL